MRLRYVMVALLWALITLLFCGAIVVLSHNLARAAIPDRKLAENNRYQRQLTVDCAPYLDLAQYLTAKFNETVRAMGATGISRVELWHSPGGRTWTIVMITEGGFACALAIGESWLKR